jgi:Xaa-Pro aminopeptidase
MHVFTDHVGRTKRRGLARIGATTGCDIVVGCSPEHFPWLCNASMPSLTYIRSRPAFACVDASGAGFVVLFDGSESLIRSQSWIEDFVGWREFRDEPLEVLAAELRSRGFARARIGLDLDFLPQASFARLQRALPEATLIDSFPALTRLRAVKEPIEVATLESAAKATHEAVLEGFAASHAGDSERDIINRILAGCLARGARTILFSTFASGERTTHTHNFAGERRVAPEDMLRCDVGPRFQSWLGDLARTYSGGRPDQRQRDLHRSMVEMEQETIAAIRPGVSAESVYKACCRAAARTGIPFTYSHVGHSFGLELHEPPMMRPGDCTELQPGMVLNIEPMVRDLEAGLFMHTEDLVEVTETGARVLTLGLAPEEIPVIGTA